MESQVDVLIVGGGLAGSLTALKFAIAKPELKLLLIESSGKLGGNKTWSFHESDLTEDQLSWIKPMVARSWKSTRVQFPRLDRTIDVGYHSFRSEDLHSYVTERLGESVMLETEVDKVSEHKVYLKNGEIIEAHLVLDARGIDYVPTPKLNGFQKFIGFDLLLEEPHGLESPVIMDATCPQLEGFRFFYLLPWDANRLLIEETFYSDTPDLNRERISRSILSYAERKGWKVKKVEREETGVLPIPMTAYYIPNSHTGEAIPIGTRGGYFHATTGYSLADAARFADLLLASPTYATGAVRESLMKSRRKWLSKQRFYRMLNRFLFYASEPSLRYQVLQHFYEQPQEVVERFYGGRTTWSDRLRILSGRPPVPLNKALKSLTERSVQARFGGPQ
jgi:lycopene beta-cyclase